MSKKAGSLYDEQGNPVWLFHTKFKAQHGRNQNGEEIWSGDPFVLYDFTADQEYAKLLDKGLKGQLGDLPNGQGKKLGENYHTSEMHDRSALCVADKFTGDMRTSVREIAIKIASEVPDAVLDLACDQSILGEVKAKRVSDKRTPAERAADALNARNTLAPKA